MKVQHTNPIPLKTLQVLLVTLAVKLGDLNGPTQGYYCIEIPTQGALNGMEWFQQFPVLELSDDFAPQQSELHVTQEAQSNLYRAK